MSEIMGIIVVPLLKKRKQFLKRSIMQKMLKEYSEDFRIFLRLLIVFFNLFKK